MKIRHFNPKHQKNSLFLKVLIAVGALMTAALILAGGIMVTQAILPSETEFESVPPQQNTVEPEKQKRKVITKNVQKRNSSLVKRINIVQPQQINTPQVEISLPSGMGGDGTDGFSSIDMSGMANLGKVKIDLPEFDIFGVKGSSDRVLICFDVCEKTMKDEMGALPAFNVVKNEIATLVRGLPATCLFNVMAFDMNRGQKHGNLGNGIEGGNVNCIEVYRQNLVPANSSNKSAFESWIKKFNTTERPEDQGVRDANYDLRFPYVPFNEGFTYENHVWQRHGVVYWYMAYQAAIEQGAGVIYFLTTHWPRADEFWVKMTPAERKKHVEQTKKNAENFEKGGGKLVTPEEKGKFYAIAREVARKMIEEENAARAKKGMPPMVMRDSWGYAIQKGIPEAKTAVTKKTWDDFAPKFKFKHHTNSSIMAHYEPIFKKVYDERGLKRPVFNMIIMLPKAGDPEWQKKYFKNASAWARQNNKGVVRILRGAKPLSEYNDPDKKKESKTEKK